MKIAVLLAEGFEELEAVSVIDTLRRAGIDTLIVSLAEAEVYGSHGIGMLSDKVWEEVDFSDLDGVVLPGGLPGATRLGEDQRVLELIRELHKEERMIAAICAAPVVLEKAGVIKGRNATSYPSFEESMESCSYSEDRVVTDGHIITARGPGVALEFALQLVGYLRDKEQAEELREKMLVAP